MLTKDAPKNIPILPIVSSKYRKFSPSLAINLSMISALYVV